MDRSKLIQTLRHLVSVRGDRLVLRTSLNPSDSPGVVWVARSGDDPRSWFRDDLPENRTPWRHGRFPHDECFIPIFQLQKHKDTILRRIAAHRQWARSPAAAVFQEGRLRQIREGRSERSRKVAKAHRLRKKLSLRFPPAKVESTMRRWAARVAQDDECDARKSSSRSWLHALPNDSPLRRPSLLDEETPPPQLPLGSFHYHPPSEEFFYRRHLLRRWAKLDGWQRWLEAFPPGALEFLERHGFTDRKWHLLNLWIRVPEGRLLFDEVPLLAYALASAWCFRGRQDKNLFRSIRRKVHRKRTEILSWLGFPPQRRVIAFLQQLKVSEIGMPQLLRARTLLQHPVLSMHLTQLPFTLKGDDFFLLNRPPYPGFPMLKLMLRDRDHPDAQAAADLYLDTQSMIETLGGPHSPFFDAVTRARSLRRLKEVHDEVSRASLMERIRETRQAEETLKGSREFDVPLEGNATIHPLKTVDQVLDEAQDMRHCLHSYLNRIAGGRYFAYSVMHAGERATLGLERMASPSSPWLINQIQGKQNSLVSDPLRQHVETWLKSAKPPMATLQKTIPDPAQLEFSFGSP